MRCVPPPPNHDTSPMGSDALGLDTVGTDVLGPDAIDKANACLPLDPRYSTIFEYFDHPDRYVWGEGQNHITDQPIHSSGQNPSGRGEGASEQPDFYSGVAAQHTPSHQLAEQSELNSAPSSDYAAPLDHSTGQGANEFENQSQPYSSGSALPYSSPQNQPSHMSDGYAGPRTSEASSSPLSSGTYLVSSAVDPDRDGHDSADLSAPSFQFFDDDAFAILLGGAASSQADEGITNGFIKASLIDYGPYSIAFGSSEFSSVGVGYGTAPTTNAVSYAEISGADFIFKSTTVGDLRVDGAVADLSGSYSATQFIAIDVDHYEPQGGAVEYTLGSLSAPSSLNGTAGGLPDAASSGALFDAMSGSQILSMFLQQAGGLVQSPGLTQLATVETGGSVLAPAGYVAADNSAFTLQNNNSIIDGAIVLIA